MMRRVGKSINRGERSNVYDQKVVDNAPDEIKPILQRVANSIMMSNSLINETVEASKSLSDDGRNALILGVKRLLRREKLPAPVFPLPGLMDEKKQGLETLLDQLQLGRRVDDIKERWGNEDTAEAA